MVALTIVAIAISNVSLNKAKNSAHTSLLNIEALSGCEVSSDPSKNTGYCVKKTGSNEDVCVDSSSSGAVRCSGNY
ncbi:MAG: hypothetical protein LBQ22_01035 [Bacteroidales bacterium]|nr:hypothetical protein [Bacteroidales bacterium]